MKDAGRCHLSGALQVSGCTCVCRCEVLGAGREPDGMAAHLQPRSYQRLAMPAPTPGSFLKSALEAPPSLSCRTTPFESCTAWFALCELKCMLGHGMGE